MSATILTTPLLILFRLILTTVLIASKMFNDTYYTNKYIAQVGGVSLQNINELETFFIEMVDWNLNITEEQFAQYEHLIAAFLKPAPQSPYLDPSVHSALATGHASPNSQSINPSYPYQSYANPATVVEPACYGSQNPQHLESQVAAAASLEYRQQ